MKIVKNTKTGELYCLHCRSYDCICLPETNDYTDWCESGFNTTLEVKEIKEISPKADVIYFYKQKLPNGLIIPSGFELCVPKYKYITKRGSSRPKIILSNDIINKMNI